MYSLLPMSPSHPSIPFSASLPLACPPAFLPPTLPPFLPCQDAYMHMHVRTHTHTHARMHACTHTHTHTHARARTHKIAHLPTAKTQRQPTSSNKNLDQPPGDAPISNARCDATSSPPTPTFARPPSASSSASRASAPCCTAASSPRSVQPARLNASLSLSCAETTSPKRLLH